MKTKLFALLAVSTLLLSCARDESENVNQDRIFQHLEVLYVDAEDKTHVSAWFRFGGLTGTLLELSEPATIVFNGDDLMYNTVIASHRKEYAGFVDNGTFVYTDIDGNVFTNQAPQVTPIDFPEDLTEISAGSAFTFEWVGEPIGPGETITLWIDGTQQNNSELFTTILQNNTQIILGVNKLSNLGLGEATCWLVRTTKKDLDEETSVGGFIESKYRAIKKITIVE
jgi:hypothetical protein